MMENQKGALVVYFLHDSPPMLSVANLSDYKRGVGPELPLVGQTCQVSWKKKAHEAIVLEVEIGPNASTAKKTLNQKVQDESMRKAYIKMGERFAMDATKAIDAAPEFSAVDGPEHGQSVLQNRDEENIDHMLGGRSC